MSMDLTGLLERVNGDPPRLLVAPRAEDRQWAQYQLTPMADELTKHLWSLCRERNIYHLDYDRAYPSGVGGPFLGPDDWRVLEEDARQWMGSRAGPVSR